MKTAQGSAENAENLLEQKKTTANQSGLGWVNHLGNYVGSDKPVDLNWRVLFSDVLQNHSRGESKEIFICGTRTTTPAPQDIFEELAPSLAL